MKNELRQIINLLKFSNCNTVKWSILQKWSQTVDLIHTYLARRRWYDTNWLGLMKITHEQHISCRITRFVVSNFWRYEWDWNEHSQSWHLLFLLQEQRRRDLWSSTIFKKHNITWDTIQWRCRQDDFSRRTAWFARTRILQKKNIHYPWVYWSRSRDMWFGRYRWSCRFKIWYQIFADHCEFIIFREIDVKKYSETNFINIIRYYQCKIQYLSPTCQKDLPSNVVTSVSLTKSEGEFTQESDSLYCHRVSLDEIERILIFNDIWTDLYLRNLFSCKKYK